jgi:hypothetical protein
MVMEEKMMRSGILAGVSALALVLAAAAPTATLARGGGGVAPSGGGGGAHFGGGGGGAHFSGGGGGMHMGGGGGSFGGRSFGAARVGGGNFGAARVGGGNFAAARVGGPAYSGAGGNWHGGHGYYRHGRFFPFAAGIAAGAALGAYAYYDDPYYYGADPYYYDEGATVVVPGGGDASYCAQRYRSWDPATGTYLGYDGQRHPCP